MSARDGGRAQHNEPMTDQYGQGHAPATGTRAPDGSVWNGQFWEMPPGGAGGPSVDALRAEARRTRDGRTDGVRSSRSDLVATTLASVVLSAVAAVVAVLLGSDTAMEPGLVATLASGAGLVVGGVIIVVQHLRMDRKNWYITRSDRRSMGAGAAIGVDVLQAVLGYLAPVALTVAGAAAEDRVLALSGSTSAVWVGLTVAIWAGRGPLRADRRKVNGNVPGRQEVVQSPVRRGRAVRWTRFLIGFVLGVAGALPSVLVPAPAPETGLIIGLVLAGAVTGWIFFAFEAWWQSWGNRAGVSR